MRSSRLLAIQLLLQSRGRQTAGALAEEFEVSVRTIYRDVEALSAAGVPIYAERGPRGGFQLLDGSRSKLTGLHVTEAAALAMPSDAAAMRDLGITQTATSARLKVLATMSPAASTAADRVARRVLVDPTPWFRRHVTPVHLVPLAQAVWENRVIDVSYEGWDGVRHRQLDPLGLVLKGDVWYVVARRDGQNRIYRVDGIRSIEVTTRTFTHPRRFKLPTYWRREVARFERDLVHAHATIRVAPEAMGRIDRLGSMAPHIRDAAIDADGWRRCTVPIESIATTAQDLLSFGSTIVVNEPAALRSAIVEAARRLIDLYDAEPGGDT